MARILPSIEKGGTVYGEIHVSLPGEHSRKMSVSRIVYLASHNEIEAFHQVSHLCHNSRCCEISHLTAETSQMNKHRQKCNRLGYCRGHGKYPPCVFFEKRH